MRRSKAVVSVEVKQVIEALCRLLAAAGLHPVPPPDTFRRAKFGGEAEVENQFWQLLANILQITSSVSPEVNSDSERRKLVVAGLWQAGYHADWMYGEEVRGFSSRDLLLALGWLLATGALEKLLNHRVQQLDKTLLTPTLPVNSQISHELQVDSTTLRRLQWLIGHLRHQGRTLLSMQEERARLLHALSSDSLSSSASPAPSSSAHQSPAVLKEEDACMQELCNLLDAYLRWKKVEKVFWSWMDSVLDCLLKDPVVEGPARPVFQRAAVCHHGNPGLKKLEDMLSRLGVGQLHNTHTPPLISKGTSSTSSHSGLPPSLLPPPPALSQAYRPRFQAGTSQRHGDHPAEDDAGAMTASQAARLLLCAEAQLLETRDTQRLARRTQLQEMIGRREELVLIPPQTSLQQSVNI